MISDSDVSRELANAMIGAEDREHFLVMFLTTQNQLIKAEVIFQGTIDEASVWPRDIAKRCLELNATGVILAHNHPSGVLEPSRADLNITQKIKETLALFEIRTLDHIIVANGLSMSLADRGMM